MNDFPSIYEIWVEKRNEFLLLLQNHINLGLKLKHKWNLLPLVYGLSDTIIIIKRRFARKISSVSINLIA